MTEHRPEALGDRDEPLRDQVAAEIRQRIVEGRYAPGDRIVERELAAELAVSRVPVREALRTLRVEGFLEDVARRGVIVRRVNREDVEELFDMREALEVMACRLAAQHSDAHGLNRLRQFLAHTHQSLESDLDTLGQANEDFHDEIIRMSGHRLLASMLEPLQGRLHWLFRQIDDPQAVCAEHDVLYHAIASGDADKAGAEALSHVRHNREVALRVLFE